MSRKTAIVTGGAKGIGTATVEKLFLAGYNVVLNYNKSELQADEIVKRLNSNKVVSFKADITSEKMVKELFLFTYNTFNSIDLLVNNAGVSKQALLQDTTEQDFDQLVNVNIKGCYLCCKEAISYLINKENGAAIVNISSICGISGSSCESVYSATKSAVIGFTKALAKELVASGVTVNCIAPGGVDTQMLNELKTKDYDAFLQEIPMKRLATPAEIADIVVFFASEKARYFTGQIISPNGGIVI